MLKSFLFRLGAIGILFFITQTSTAAKKYTPPELQAPPANEVGVDPLIESAWYLERMGVYSAWQITRGSRDVVIAIVDSGINYNHPELANSLKHNLLDCNFNGVDDDRNGYVDDCVGYNFSEWVSLPWDDGGHGTFIASIIAGENNNKVGSSGVCPGCSIMPIRFLDSDGFGDDGDSINGIEYAVKMHASVINLSFAGEGYDQKLRNILKEALAQDIVIVAAAGNDGANNDKQSVYPANYHMPNLLSVASSRRDNDLSEESNYGARNVHLAAAGTTIWGLWSDSKWYRSQGTSFAAPMVAATAGLMRSANPRLSAVEVVTIIKNTVTLSPALKGKVRMGGVLNADAAVRCAVDPELSCLKKK
ncbi:MAG: hypothetical protein A2Z20_12230 [Bdellovibrionales bacterium RBG_16_40_8]|nr:MAG: hypothetical protein A2Z20_12230 [Bdellovibrionales bacterium RBG_16_40_8]